MARDGDTMYYLAVASYNISVIRSLSGTVSVRLRDAEEYLLTYVGAFRNCLIPSGDMEKYVVTQSAYGLD